MPFGEQPLAREHETHAYHVAETVPAEVYAYRPVDEWGQLTRDEIAACFASVLDNFPPGEAV